MRLQYIKLLCKYQMFVLNFGKTRLASGAMAMFLVVPMVLYMLFGSSAGALNGTNTALLSGTQVSGGGTNLNLGSKTALSWNSAQEYDSSYFSYSGANNTRLTATTTGDYFVSVTVPITSNASVTNNRNAIEAEFRINGTKADVGVGRSSFIRNIDTHLEGSVHLSAMLSLSANDYVEVHVARTTTETTNTLTSNTHTIYAEYVEDETIYYGTGTETTNSTNLNQTTAYEMEWSADVRKDTGYTHSTSTSPEDVTLDAANSYFVSVNIPIGGAVQRANIKGKVLLDGSQVAGGVFQQGYIRNSSGHIDSSIHYSGVVTSESANQIVSVSVEQEANTGTITVDGEKATIYIQELPSEGLFYGQSTQLDGGSGDWNPSTAADVEWGTSESSSMTVTDIDSATGGGGGVSVSTTGVSEGDFLILSAQQDRGVSTFGTPTGGGWTEQSSDEASNGEGTFSAKIWTKTAGASESSTYSVSGGSGADLIVQLAAVTGTSPSFDVEASSNGSSTSDPSDIVAPSVTTTEDNTILFNVWTVYPAGWGSHAITEPGSTNILEEDVNGNDFVITSTGYETIASAGVTGTRTATANNPDSPNGWTAASLAIKDTGGGGSGGGSIDIIDTDTYTHSTSTDANQITVEEDGDYMVALNSSYTTDGCTADGRCAPKATIRVNDTLVSGAESKSSYIRNADSHSDSSNSLMFMLEGLSDGDIITVQMEEGGDTGSVDDDAPSTLLIWRKNLPPEITQSTYRWYNNADSVQPGGHWTGEGDPLTLHSSSPFLSGANLTEIRLRMGLTAGGVDIPASSQDFKLQYAKASSGGSWMDSDWSLRREITIDNSASTENLTDFPLLVKLNSSRIDYSETQNSGQDIRFTDRDGTTLLDYEIEEWNESGDSFVWVKVPQIDAGSTTDSIYVYYGNNGASDGQDAAGVWSNNYEIVYHMNQDPSGSAPQIQDSTSNNRHATSSGSMASGDLISSSQIGQGIDFDGTDDELDSNFTFTGTDDFTVQAWGLPDDLDSCCYSSLASQEIFETSGYRFGFRQHDPAFWTNENNGTLEADPSTGSLTDDTWYNLAGTYDGTTGRIYQDGSEESNDTGTMTTPTTDFIVGQHGGGEFDGVIDEVRLSSIERSAEWIEADHLSMTDAMNTYGSEEDEASVLGGGSQQDWYDTDWSARRKITLDNTSSGSNLVDFPILIKLDSTRVDYTKTQNSGQDIRFTDEDGTTLLDYEIEEWSESGDSVSFVWVKVPQIDANSDTDYIYMYYGNSGAADAQDAAGVWDNGYLAVYHFGEGSGTSYADSTGNNTALGVNGSSTDSPNWISTSQIGTGLEFDNAGTNFEGLVGDIATTTTLADGYTLSSWLKTTTQEDMYTIDGKSTPGTGTLDQIWLAPWGDGSFNGNFYAGHETSGGEVEANTDGNTYRYEDDSWHNWTSVWDPNGDHYTAGDMLLYRDDEEAATRDSTSNELNLGMDSVNIGGNSASSALDGELDEVRISNVPRSADWVEAEYLTMTDSMNTYGAEEGRVGWYDSSWNTRRKITLDNSASTENLTDFPILVKLDSTRIDYNNTQNAGQDIRFTDSDGSTELDYEIETWNESGDSFVWVKVPQIDSGSTTDFIYMYYGNSGASDGQNASAVWSNGYEMVLHFGEGSGTTYADSTGNWTVGISCPSGNCKTPAWTTGQVGPALDFDGGADYDQLEVNMESAPYNHSNGYTLSAWVHASTTASDQNVLNMQNEVDNEETGYIFLENGGIAYGGHKINGGGFIDASDTYDTNLHHWATTWDPNGDSWTAGNISLMKDGTHVDTSNTSSGPDATDWFYIGADWNSTTAFTGMVDEVRFTNAERSESWLEAEYLTMADNMNTFGGEEEFSVGSGGLSESDWVDVGDSTSNDTLTTRLLGSNSGCCTTLSVSSGTVAEGELMILFAQSDREASSITLNETGWTEQTAVTTTGGGGSGGDAGMKVWTKIATASEPSTYDITSETDSDNILVLVGVASSEGANLSVDAVGSNDGDSTSATAPTITTSSEITSLIRLWSAYPQTASVTLSEPSGMTQLTDDISSNDYIVTQAYYEDLTSSGATGTESVSISSSQVWAAVSIAIKSDYTGSSSADWIYLNNTTPTDGATITTNLLSAATVLGSYTESNPTATNPNAITAGSMGEWDFSLDASEAEPGEKYYFRVVPASGDANMTYDTYPTITLTNTPEIPNMDQMMRGGGWFNDGLEQPKSF